MTAIFKKLKLNESFQKDFMEKVTLLLYTHTEYSDLWPIFLDEPFPRAISRIIAMNKTKNTQQLQPYIDHGFIIHMYDDQLSYSEKIISCLKEIHTPYVWFVHDNDILQSFHQKTFDEVIHCLDEQRIDRLMFGIVSKEGGEIQNPLLHIGRVNYKTTPHFITPYDVGPSIWRVSAFARAMESVKGVGYREIESSEIQNFCKENLNMWGFFTHPQQKSSYVIGRPFPESFQYLHLCVRGMLLEDDKYMDQKENFKKLVSLHPTLNDRGILRGQDHIRIDFRTV